MISTRQRALGALLVAAGAALGGCGGGGGSGGSSSTGGGGGTGGGTVTTTVSGVVSAGLVSGATVTATCGTGSTPIGSSAATDGGGRYVISLSQDCVNTPVLLTARPSNNGMTVADEVLGPVTVAANSAWRLRAYFTLTGQSNSDVNITPLTDMAVELVDAVRTGQNHFASGAAISGQTSYPLSTALVRSANAVVAVILLGDDQTALGANPVAPTSINPADIGQVQLSVLLASLSMWANNNASAPPWNVDLATNTSGGCQDPVVCGGDASALAALEKTVVGDLGNHLVMSDYTPDAQGNPTSYSGNTLSSNGTATAAAMPANALAGSALSIEATTPTSGPTTIPYAIASAPFNASAPFSPVSTLLASSAVYIQNGYPGSF